MRNCVSGLPPPYAAYEERYQSKREKRSTRLRLERGHLQLHDVWAELVGTSDRKNGLLAPYE